MDPQLKHNDWSTQPSTWYFRENFSWKFIIANVTTPIISADLLAEYNLLVDCSYLSLIGKRAKLSVKGRHSDTSFALTASLDIIRKFPNLLKPNLVCRLQINLIEHQVKTTGQPVSKRARCLAPENNFIARQSSNVCMTWKSSVHLIIPGPHHFTWSPKQPQEINDHAVNREPSTTWQ